MSKMACLLLIAATTVPSAAAAGVVLPEWPDCEYSCNRTVPISPDSGNKIRIWPKCNREDGDCRSQCRDLEPECARYAAAYDGYGCEDNPSFMLTQCPSSCNACHILNATDRCAELKGYPEALKPGSINTIFNRMLNLADYNATVLSEDPWLVLLHDVVREDELDVLLRDGRAWTRASDTGALGADGRHKQHFSSTRKTDVHWCHNNCIDEPPIVRLISRISEISMVHSNYFEQIQLLRYKRGMYYKTHHDAGARQKKEFTSGRVITAFIYLSDVEEGGETNFPKLNISVKPEKGAMLFWPSVLDADPSEIDQRTSHGALPVIEGLKFSANVWINGGPFLLAHHLGCGGSPITRREDEVPHDDEL